MSIRLTKTAFVAGGAERVSLSQMLSITHDGHDPAYLIVDGVDQSPSFSGGGPGAAAVLQGNGATAAFAPGVGPVQNEAALVFAWDEASGTYRNPTYGSLLDLTIATSGRANDLADLTFIGTNAPGTTKLGVFWASQPAIWTDYGTASLATTTTGAASATGATPDAVAAAAQHFAGASWSTSGSWVLANTIAAEAGAALPATTLYPWGGGMANTPWKVAYIGASASGSGWTAVLRPGDIVDCGGMLSTVVSGQGASAMVIDSPALPSSGSSWSNPVIAAPHALSVASGPGNVIVYRLDTPTVAAKAATASLASGASEALGALFAASDWAGTAITGFQVYGSSSAASLVMGGAVAASAAASPVSVASLAGIALRAGGATGSDTISVRAQNAAGYWGDWRSVTVLVAGPVPASPPVLAHQTPSVTLKAGQALGLSLAAAFTDPQGEPLRETVGLASGQALPAWLAFDAATGTLHGTAPVTAGTVSLKVTATNAGGLAASETVTITDLGRDIPKLATPTPAQTAWSGHAFTVAAGAAFTDPLGEALRFTATLASGAALPSWLTANPATGALSGVAPGMAQNLSLKLTATNADGQSASETVAVAVRMETVTLAAQTANQTWTQGQAVDLALPAGAFVDAAGESLTYKATQAGGAALPAGLTFDAAHRSFGGTAPITPQTLMLNVTATDTDGIARSETFAAFVKPAAPSAGVPVPTQRLSDGQKLSLPLASAFSDPQRSALAYSATEIAGPDARAWLHLDNGVLDGTVPGTGTGVLGLRVAATDRFGLSATQTFAVAYGPSGSVPAGAVFTNATPAGEALLLHG